MARRIAEISLELPEFWYWMPEPGRALTGWQQEMASQVIPPDKRTEATIARLVEHLNSVYRSVESSGFTGIRSAVMAPPTWAGGIAAVISLRATQVGSLDAFGAELAHWTQGSPEETFQRVDPLEADLPAGRALGVRVIKGNVYVDDLGTQSQALEERIVIGIEPPGSNNLVEVVVIAAGLGAFQDLPGDILALLQGLRVRVA